RQLSEIPNAPAETSALEEVTPTPEPADAMNGIYSVKTQEDAEKILEQAYEGMVTQLNFSFSDQTLSLQDRYILLQNAANQIVSRRPELKYAYQLECTESPDG